MLNKQILVQAPIDAVAQSPCVRNCCLNEDDVCLGCFRSLEEITRWNEADEQERVSILNNTQQRREAYNSRIL
ncbi:MAG: DUF1289 domain-containing protein [Gallionellaceae bacterium]